MIKNKDKNKIVIFILCLLGYSGAYLCRLNFSAAMPEMANANIFTSSELGTITSLFFITYGFGQLISGYLGDKVSPRYMMFIGLVLSGAVNLLIMFFSSYYSMAILWGLNGFAQSMLWPPIIYIMGNYFEATEKTKFAKYFSISVPVGTLASYGLSMLWISVLNWKFVFALNGIIIILIAIVWFIFSSKSLNLLKQNSLDYKKDMVVNTSTEKQNVSFGKSLFISGLIFMCVPIAIHGGLKDSVTTWVPTFVVQNFNTLTSISLLLTMILPIINLTGGFLASLINDKIKNEVFTSSIFFLVAILASCALLFFGKSSLIVSICCLAILTNCMFAINLLTISLMPMRFYKYNKVSTVSGLLNSVAYLGCAVVNWAVGFFLDKYSWTGIIMFWTILAIFAYTSSIIISFVWKKFTTNQKKVLF